MHCHIAWHASAGLALQWVELPDQIPHLMSLAPEINEQYDQICAEWQEHEAHKCMVNGSVAIQDDSGI